MEKQLFELNKLHIGLTYDQYHQGAIDLKALRSSGLKPLLKSAAHYKAAQEKPSPVSDALRIGKLVHSLFENTEKFLDTYILEPEFDGKTQDGKPSTRSKDFKEKRAAWYAALPKDATVVYPEDIVMIQTLAKNIKSKPIIKGMIRDSISESSVFVKDPETGVHLACRPDLITSRGHVIDYKTTIDASPSYFLQQIFRNGKMSQFYLLQAAHYAYCMKVAGIGTGESFTFIAIDKDIWDFMLYPLDIGCLGAGDQWRALATKRYAEALMKDEWQGYKDPVVAVNVPEWLQVPEADQE